VRHKREYALSEDPSAEEGSALSSMVRRLFGWLFRSDPPAPAPPRDPERDKYRACDPSTRDVATCYADPLDVVVDAAIKNVYDQGPANQLAKDLSGRYGPYTVRWEGSGNTKWLFGFDSGKYVQLDGLIFDEDDDPVGGDDTSVGLCRRKFYRDDEGRLVVENDRLELEEFAQHRGFSTALSKELEHYYRRSGVDLVTVHATEIGGYTWAREGFDWDPNSVSLRSSLDDIRRRIEGLIADAGTDPADQVLLRQICDRLNEDDLGKGCPTPKELADPRGVDTELGKKVMIGIDWHGIRWLTA
jgi:GNAT superfamily N-acetyltransferase